MKTKRAYQFRFYPTDEQRIILAQTFGCVRFVSNWGLSTRQTAYKERGETLSYHDLAALLPDLKKQYPWLKDVSSVPLQQSLRHLDRAFVNFFEGRANYPTFKKKQNAQSATYASNAFKWEGNALTLAKMNEPLDIHWHRPLPKDVKPSSVTITKDCANRYFVSILVEEDIKPLPITPKMVGLDLGIKSMVALSTGESKLLKRSFNNLVIPALLPRMRRSWQKPRDGMRRKRKAPRTGTRHGSKSLAFTLGSMIAEGTTSTSIELLKRSFNNCVESLAVKNLIKNHCLAKAISDVGWSEFIRQLEYKSQWYEIIEALLQQFRTLVKIDRWYPSSKTCHACKHVLDSLTLDIREWGCPECGMVHDRDTNAALNILAEGLSVAACGGSVRPVRATPREAGNSHS